MTFGFFLVFSQSSQFRPISVHFASGTVSLNVLSHGQLFPFCSYLNSDDEDTEFGDCTVMIEDDVITASQQVQTGLTGHS